MRHQPQLFAPQYVRPFVKTNKNDFAEAETICEASSRPGMRYVSVKSVDRQYLSVSHRLLVSKGCLLAPTTIRTEATNSNH